MRAHPGEAVDIRAAQKQPLRAWIPKRSSRSATTKPGCSIASAAGQRMTDGQRDDAHTLEPRIAQDPEPWIGRPGGERAPDEPVLELGDRLRAHVLPQCEDEPRTDGLDDAGRAGLLAVDGVGEVRLSALRDVLTVPPPGRPAPRWRRGGAWRPELPACPAAGSLCGEMKTASL